MNNDLQKRFHTFLYEVPAAAKGGRVQPNWLKDGNTFCYLENLPGKEGLYQVDSHRGKRICLLDQAGLMSILAAKFGQDIPLADIRFEGIRLAEDEQHIVLPIGEQEYLVDRETQKMSAVEPHPNAHLKQPRKFRWALGDAMDETRSPDGASFLGVQGGNLYLRSTMEDRINMLTSDGTEDFPYDVLDACWTPDSRLVAVHRFNLEKIPRVAWIPYLKSAGEVVTVPWGQAGEPAWGAEIHVVDTASGQKFKIDLEESCDPYINLAAWAGDELVFASSDRRCKRLTLAACRPGGKMRTLLTETAPTFHNYNEFSRLPIYILMDGKRFLWLSERDGWARLYLYDMDGKLICRVSGEECEVREITMVDEENGWAYFLAGPSEALYEQHLYRARLDGSASERLTAAAGFHEVQFSPSKQFFLDSHSNLVRPYAVDLYRADGQQVLHLSEMDVSMLTGLGWRPPEETWVTALDGKTPLRAVEYTPADFDPQRKYPVIEYIYGGPHTNDTTRAYCGFPLLDALAQSGFVVLVVDGRGSYGRGKAFQDVCYGKLGSYEIPEHVHALHELAAQRPYMDMERVGVFGLSYGGYLTLRAILSAPDVYRVAVATCPPPGVQEMVWAYVERYMDLPEHNPQGYKDGDCLSAVGNLQGKLLIMHGTSDTNAPIAFTMKLIEALLQADKAYDLVLFPEQKHLFEGAANKYWLDRLHAYFVEHLKP